MNDIAAAPEIERFRPIGLRLRHRRQISEPWNLLVGNTPILLPVHELTSEGWLAVWGSRVRALSKLVTRIKIESRVRKRVLPTCRALAV